eukprot:NODE_425_length_8856_cov_0.734841.p1 type:complete len:481 gc:universal NODE_425_length_8856_cov_0.734841:5308-6750(+)
MTTEIYYDAEVDINNIQELRCRSMVCGGSDCAYLHGFNFKYHQVYAAMARINKLKYRFFASNNNNYSVTNLTKFLVQQRSLFVNLGTLSEFFDPTNMEVYKKSFHVSARKLINHQTCRNMLHAINLDMDVEFIEWYGSKFGPLVASPVKRTDFVGIKNMYIDESFVRKILPKDTVIDKKSFRKLIDLVYKDSSLDIKIDDLCKEENGKRYLYNFPVDLCFIENRVTPNSFTLELLRKSYTSNLIPPVAVSKSTNLPHPLPITLTSRNVGFKMIQWNEDEFHKTCQDVDFYKYFYNYELSSCLVTSNKTSLVESSLIFYFRGSQCWNFTRRHFVYNFMQTSIFTSEVPLSLLFFFFAVLFPFSVRINIYELELIVDKIFNFHLPIIVPNYVDLLISKNDHRIQFEKGYFILDFSNKLHRIKIKIYSNWLVAFVKNPSNNSEMKSKLFNDLFWTIPVAIASIPYCGKFAQYSKESLESLLNV